MVQSNWMVRALTGKLGQHFEVTTEDLNIAKRVLRQKVKIGLAEYMGESLRRFGQYLGWNERERWSTCYSKFTTHKCNAHKHPTVHPGSPEWEAIVDKNQLDMILYAYAVELFHTHDSSLTNK
jgi:hypothetical protein